MSEKPLWETIFEKNVFKFQESTVFEKMRKNENSSFYLIIYAEIRVKMTCFKSLLRALHFDKSLLKFGDNSIFAGYQKADLEPRLCDLTENVGFKWTISRTTVGKDGIKAAQGSSFTFYLTQN